MLVFRVEISLINFLHLFVFLLKELFGVDFLFIVVEPFLVFFASIRAFEFLRHGLFLGRRSQRGWSFLFVLFAPVHELKFRRGVVFVLNSIVLIAYILCVLVFSVIVVADDR